MSHLIPPDFFLRPCLSVAPDLVGKLLCRTMPDGTVNRLRILETEAYCGQGDTACHVHKGRTPRTEVFYTPGGTLYVYLCYGIHWMLNIVTGQAEQPEAVLIRSCEGAEGPGRLTRALAIDKSFNGKALSECLGDLWLEDDGIPCAVLCAPRVSIAYAAPEDRIRPWRFILQRQ